MFTITYKEIDNSLVQFSRSIFTEKLKFRTASNLRQPPQSLDEEVADLSTSNTDIEHTPSHSNKFNKINKNKFNYCNIPVQKRNYLLEK